MNRISQLPPSFRRSAMTLMELVVVLVVIIAIAGIMLPILPSMLGRANVTSCVANATEVSKAVMMYEAMYHSYPDGYDGVIAADGTIPTYIKDDAAAPGPYFTTLTLADGDIEALASGGISTIYTFEPNLSKSATHPTFNPWDGATLSLTTGSKLLTLTTSGIDRLGLPGATAANPALYRYAIFGLGKKCNMFGRTALEPAVHFADVPEESPNLMYTRAGIIYLLGVPNADGTGTRYLSRPKYVRAFAFHGDGPASADEHTAQFWKIQDDSAQSK